MVQTRELRHVSAKKVMNGGVGGDTWVCSNTSYVPESCSPEHLEIGDRLRNLRVRLFVFH